MRRLIYITVPALLAICVGGSYFLNRSNTRYTFHHENVMGTSLELQIAAPVLPAAQDAEAAALAEIERLDGILSTWDPESEVSRWMRTANEPVPVSPELFEVLGLFDEWRVRTDGALDASAEAVSRVWRMAADEDRLPTDAELGDAVASVEKLHWRLDPETGAATHLSETPLALNSFTKSYIAGRAADAALAASEATGIVVNAGGDLVVRGAMTETVDIADPWNHADNSPAMAQLLVRDRTVATSGDYYRGVEIDGRRYSHVVDPRTGRPVDHVVSSTVMAPDPATAGALATAFSVLRPDESEQLAASMPDVEYLIVTKEDFLIASRGWGALTAPGGDLALAGIAALPASFAVGPQPSGAAWDASLELMIQMELPRIGGRYRRPFVAVWIEDEDRFPLRTVALWFDRDRWLPDLRAWYRGDQLRALAEGSNITRTVSSATRSAGAYTLIWDGKDNSGRLVKPGTYTVCLEATREHGGYEILRQKMAFDGTPKQAALAGQSEIGNVSLEYRKTADR